jgi:hypothetical protein
MTTKKNINIAEEQMDNTTFMFGTLEDINSRSRVALSRIS